MFRSARICSEEGGSLRSPLHWGISLIMHSALVTVAVLWPNLADWNEPPHQATVKELLDQYTVLYYSKNDLLPMITPAAPRQPKKIVSKEASKNPAAAIADSPRVHLSPAHASQPIVSERPKPDNRRQTIVQPEAPEIDIHEEVSIPNLVAMNRDMPAPPPSAMDYAGQRIERMRLAPLPVPEPLPAPKVKSVSIAEPNAPQLRAMNIRTSDIQLNPVRIDDLPKMQVPVKLQPPAPQMKESKPVMVVKTMPDAPRAIVNGSDLSGREIALVNGEPVRMEDLPNMPVPVHIQRPATTSAKREIVLKPMPEAPSISGSSGGHNAEGLSALPSLVAVSINAPPPVISLKVPVGNRSGEFAADASGVWSQGGGLDSGKELGKPWSDAVGSRPLAPGDFSVPGLSVNGDTANRIGAPIVADRLKPQPSRSQDDNRQLLASLSRPSLRTDTGLRSRPTEEEYFGSRRVYTAHVNMPNLSSHSGSWVLRFAEPEGVIGSGDITTPYVVRKVDPSYEAAAKRDRVQGVVLLAAMVGQDGSVNNVRIVRGVDSRLDLSAISAFTQWKFQPATRNGRPIQLEVLVQIPFAID